MIVSARITVPASTRNDRTCRHVLRSSTRSTGRRYGGSSSISVGRGPRNTVRRRTAAAVSAAVTDSKYIANSATAPALTTPNTRADGPNTVAITST